MSTNLEKQFTLEAEIFDDFDAVASELLTEMFPDTTRSTGTSPYGMLSFWEDVYGIIPPSGASDAQRRVVLLARINATGGFTIKYFEDIAVGLGYKIGTHGDVGDPHLRITDGDYPPFRTGYGKAGIGKIWNQEGYYSAYTWCVRGTSVSSDTNLQEIFDDLKPAGTQVQLIDE